MMPSYISVCCDSFNAGQRGAPPGEGFQQRQDAYRLSHLRQVRDRSDDGISADQAADDHYRDGRDEDQCGHDEQACRLRDAPQVGCRDQGKHDQADRHGTAVKPRESRRQGGDAGRNANGRVQHVVDDQRSGRHQAGVRPRWVLATA
jgi:hypothetical protein